MRFYFFSKGKLNFLIVVDAYSKWLEAAGGNPHDSMTSLKTIEVLRPLVVHRATSVGNQSERSKNFFNQSESSI